MKKELFLIMILLAIPLISSLKITEVELNPKDGTAGKEWIELYNDEDNEVNISGWEIYDGLTSPTKRYTIPENTSINVKDYYVIELNNARTLNNNGDFVTLYDFFGKKIDETETLEELESSDKTWQLCDKWEFLESTKGEKNNCDDEEPSPEETEIIEEKDDGEDGEKEIETENNEGENTYEPEEPEPEISPLANTGAKENFTSEKIKKQEPELIRLNPQVIKTQIDKENSDNKTLKSIILNKNKAAYGLVVFCVLLVFLYIIKLKKTCKNEFE